jgi:predicted methyltransferase
MFKTLASLLMVALLCCGAKSPSPATVSSGDGFAPATPTADVAATMPPTPLVAADLLAAQAIVAATDRTSDDKKLDEGRKPAELLVFAGVKPGMKVAELGAGGGYTSELLARAVSPSGKVYGVNSKEILSFFAEKPWAARLAKPINTNITPVVAPFDAPFADGFADQGKLDMVINVLFYHDTVWMKTDRTKMNTNVFKSLHSGGSYVIVDHAARESDGINVTQTLHRITEKAVVTEITAAGFVLDSSADFLRNPQDPRDWNASPGDAGTKRGTSDRFVLRFRKP